MRIRIVSVTYRAGDAVTAWVTSLAVAWDRRDRTEADRIVIVAVDNASPDQTPMLLEAHAPFVTLLAQPCNRGFAAGCNLGLQTAQSGEIVVVMNPDVEVAEDFFRVLSGLDWPADLAVRGPQVLGRDGEIEQSARAFPTLMTALVGRTSVLARLFPDSPAVRRQLLARPDAGPVDVDWISGACMIAPHGTWAEVGHFDEGYFMYWEDADWCRRARDHGLRVRYEPTLVVRHRQGSSSSFRPLATIVAFHRSAWRYFRRHARRQPARDVVVAAGLAMRAALKILLALVRRHRGDGGALSRRRSRES